MEIQRWEIWNIKLGKGEREIKLLRGWIASAIGSQGRRSWTLERKNRDHPWRPFEGAGEQKANKKKKSTNLTRDVDKEWQYYVKEDV